MRHRQVMHARNLWDRAVVIMPRANQFWYKYTYMEEMLGNVAGKIKLKVFLLLIFVVVILYYENIFFRSQSSF